MLLAQTRLALDRDGDDTADVLITAYECRGEAPPPAGITGSISKIFCLDYWFAASGSWSRIRRDYYYICS